MVGLTPFQKDPDSKGVHAKSELVWFKKKKKPKLAFDVTVCFRCVPSDDVSVMCTAGDFSLPRRVFLVLCSEFVSS